jgi:hypothetical protein
LVKLLTTVFFEHFIFKGPDSQDAIISNTVDAVLVDVQEDHHSRMRSHHPEDLQIKVQDMDFSIARSQSQYIPAQPHVDDRQL